MKHTYLLIPILTSLTLPNAVCALTLQDEISAYNKGEYHQTIAIGQQLIAENINEPNRHYYLANSYSRLGQIQEAIREYSVCQNLTDEPRLKDYCAQALKFLTKNQAMAQTASGKIITGNPIFQHQQILSQEQYGLNSGINSQKQVSDITEEFRRDEQGVPKYIYDDFNNRMRNPDYALEIQNLKQQERKKLQLVRATIGTPSYQYNNIPQYNNLPQYNVPQYNNVPKYNNIPGYMKPPPYQRQAYINSLFNASPIPPPPFPVSQKKAAQKALQEKIN